MPRTTLTKTTAPGGSLATGVAPTFAAADVSNGNQFVFTGREILLARNAHASLAKTITVLSAPNAHGRSKDITAQSLAAGAWVVVGPFTRKEGWVQPDGFIYCAGQTTDIKFAVIVLPS